MESSGCQIQGQPHSPTLSTVTVPAHGVSARVTPGSWGSVQVGACYGLFIRFGSGSGQGSDTAAVLCRIVTPKQVFFLAPSPRLPLLSAETSRFHREIDGHPPFKLRASLAATGGLGEDSSDASYKRGALRPGFAGDAPSPPPPFFFRERDGGLPFSIEHIHTPYRTGKRGESAINCWDDRLIERVSITAPGIALGKFPPQVRTSPYWLLPIRVRNQ